MTPREAYEFVKNNPDCDAGKYQKIACQDCQTLLYFAKYIPNSDINFCQSVLKNRLYDYPDSAEALYLFLKNIPESDIETLFNMSDKFVQKMIGRFILKMQNGL